MCQIIVNFTGDQGLTKRIFDSQRDRGGDGVSIYFPQIDTLKKIASSNIYANWYNLHKPVNVSDQEVYETLEQYNDFVCILHERKGSVGGKDPELMHPWIGNNNYIWHNGTLKGEIIESLMEFYDSKSDTHLISQLISTYNDWVEISEILNKLSESSTSGIGIVIIYNKKLDQIFVFTDGTREMFIKFSEDRKNVEYISNYINKEKDGMFLSGYILMGLGGNIIEKDIDIVDYGSTKKKLGKKLKQLIKEKIKSYGLDISILKEIYGRNYLKAAAEGYEFTPENIQDYVNHF